MRITEAEFALLARTIPTVTVRRRDISWVDAVLALGWAASRTDARRLLESGAVYLFRPVESP